jgi:hypothetical protein
MMPCRQWGAVEEMGIGEEATVDGHRAEPQRGLGLGFLEQRGGQAGMARAWIRFRGGGRGVGVYIGGAG